MSTPIGARKLYRQVADAILASIESGEYARGSRLPSQATRNAAITAVIEHLWDIRDKSPLCAKMLDRARSAGVKPRISEHRRILAALRKHDPQAACNAMRNHLGRVIDGLLAATEFDAVDSARRKAVTKRHEYTRRLAI